MKPSARLTIRKLRVRSVDVPMARPVETSAAVVHSAPLTLIDLETEQGITGSSYVFAYTPVALRSISGLVAGIGPWIEGDIVAPLLLQQKLKQRFRLLGGHGLTAIAMAGIDMAAWDALAKASEVPLVTMLGGTPAPVPAYGSLRSMQAEAAADEAREAMEAGFFAAKVKIGHASVNDDVRVIEAIRKSTKDQFGIMVDYNQCLTVAQAIERCKVLEREGLRWIEEPTRAEDYAGHAAISRELNTPVQAGENWWGPLEFSKAIRVGAADLLMPDAMKVGGVTGWMQTAALADVSGLAMTSHLFPEFSVHLLAASPTAHCMESFDLAGPILEEPIEFRNGSGIIPDRPGAGLRWNEATIAKYLVE